MRLPKNLHGLSLEKNLSFGGAAVISEDDCNDKPYGQIDHQGAAV
jgi:hypothetical protein